MKKTLVIGLATTGTLMGLAVTTLVAAAVLFGNSYGERISFKNGELYYTEKVNADEAEALASFLEDQYGDLQNKKTLQVDRQEKDVIVRMCAQAKTWQTDELDVSFQALEILIQTHVFPNENVVVELCNQYLEPQKTIDFWPAKQVEAAKITAK